MKNPRWSKLLSLFLVLAMLVQMMPVMSFADDDDLPSFSETAPESAVVTVLGGQLAGHRQYDFPGRRHADLQSGTG